MLRPVDFERRTVELLRHAGCVFAEDEARLLIDEARRASDLERMVRRRASGEPLEYVLGWAEFCGCRVAVANGVFVPRRRTEFLVTQAAALAPEQPVVLDLCCGSGAIGVALQRMLDRVELHGADVDPAAVTCARQNGVRAYQGDLYDALPDTLRGRCDLIVANAPYVPTVDLPLLPREARLYEHEVALDGGPDGLDVYRRIAAGAGDWLRAGGYVLIETGERQAAAAARIFEGQGLRTGLPRSSELEVVVVTAQCNGEAS